MNLPTIPITNKRILFVENDLATRQSISQLLEIEGYHVHQAKDSIAALRFMQQIPPDLILSDINLNNGVGNNFYQTIRQNSLLTTIPIICLTSNDSPEILHDGRELGIEDFLTRPVNIAQLIKIVAARLLRAAELKIALIDNAYLETVNVLAKTVEGRDPYTHGHIERVAIYTQWLAEAMNWPAENLRILAFGARLHDIGKIIVPDQILKKQGKLTKEEWELMKQHPVAGAKILSSIEHLKAAIPYVLHHHENWDGSGYPHQLKNRDIPIEGRMLALSDVYDALTTSRPYHPAYTFKEAKKHLFSYTGKQFDPELVEIFVEVLEERTKRFNLIEP